MYIIVVVIIHLNPNNENNYYLDKKIKKIEKLCIPTSSSITYDYVDDEYLINLNHVVGDQKYVAILAMKMEQEKEN